MEITSKVEPIFVNRCLWITKYKDYLCFSYKKKTFVTKKNILFLEREILLNTNKIYNKQIKNIVDFKFINENGGHYFESELIFHSFSQGIYHVFDYIEF